MSGARVVAGATVEELRAQLAALLAEFVAPDRKLQDGERIHYILERGEQCRNQTFRDNIAVRWAAVTDLE